MRRALEMCRVSVLQVRAWTRPSFSCLQNRQGVIVPTCLFGYCDDLAIATLELADTWALLDEVFRIVPLVSNLSINSDKTQFWCIFQSYTDAAFRKITSITPTVLRACMQSYVRYLGVNLGPGADETQWALALKGFCDAAAFIKHLGVGLVPSISLYNILAMSRLG